MDTKTKTYFMIADAHIAGGEVEQEFFRMLERLSALPSSVAVVFLGDIFELWIALHRYEADLHRRFIRWCETEKQKRQIIFTEGNHEFFLPRRLFTRSGRGDIRINDLLFTHGDRINPKDIPYLFFRMGVRNFFTKGVLYLTGPAFGPKVAENIRLSLKTRKNIYKKDFPEKAIRKMMQHAQKKGIKRIFLGHFHDSRDFEQEGIRLHALPAFQNTGIAGIYEADQDVFRSGAWAEMLSGLEQTIQQ